VDSQAEPEQSKFRVLSLSLLPRCQEGHRYWRRLDNVMELNRKDSKGSVTRKQQARTEKDVRVSEKSYYRYSRNSDNGRVKSEKQSKFEDMLSDPELFWKTWSSNHRCNSKCQCFEGLGSVM